MRNEEWVNGRMPGMCMACAGSNSDVKLNDRLPITELTHEQFCKKQRCLVKHHNLKEKTTRELQRLQTTAIRYFGGYIGKRSPIGNLEVEKCVNKLYILRAKKTRFKQSSSTSCRKWKNDH